MIIKDELDLSAWTDWHADPYYMWTSISGIKRCVALATVCRAWRDAIENTPELTRYILMEYQKTNVEYVRRCNRNGPLDIVLGQGTNVTWNELSSLLGSLVHRVCALNVWATQIVTDIPLQTLQAVRIESVFVPPTFAADLLGVILVNQGLAELILHSISGGAPEPDSPRLRIDHSGLRRVRLTRLPQPLVSHILHCLGLKNSVMMKTDGVCLETLSSPDSAFGDLIRSRARDGSYALRVEVTPSGTDVAGDWYGGRVGFCYNVRDQALLPGGQSQKAEASGSWDRFESDFMTSERAVDMVRTLQDCGMKSVMIGGWPVAMLADLLQCLSPVTRLQLRSKGTLDLLHQLGQPIQKNPESGDEHPQFLCPNLTTLDLGNAMITSYHSSSVHSGISLMLQKRHAAMDPANGPARLQKIVLPPKWHTENDFSGPLFEGIEIHSKK
ncbi:hypothetical protein FS837_007939 [Tulasnella sp. UAMH 9824]|nr:hypothetical protein FS837_007939 [Tulasnella sp. UAMH 9824]